MPPTKTKLDDLSEKERAALLDELRAEQARAAETDEAEAAAQYQRIGSLMDDRDHLRDCPKGRTEVYAHTRPPNPDKGTPKKDVTVVRCQECGGTTVIDEPYKAVLARLNDDEPEV